MIYGDSADSGLTIAQATDSNLLGNLYRHYDEAGLLEISSYDFKGNILEKSRRTIRDGVILSVFTPAPVNWQVNAFRVDWQHSSGSDLDTHAATLLDAAPFQTSLQYDALNRVKRMSYPEDVDGERKELLPDYNRAGALESVIMDGDDYVQHIAYNAKGQRILIAYGNGIMTRHAYDPLTFRLLRMRTERFSQPDSLIYHPQGQALQDMRYEYDLHGNMLSLYDRAPGSGIALQPDQLDREFTYDPIYRLLTATGRECDLPASTASTQPWEDAPRCMDVTRTRAYTERYQYDVVGNMEQLRHHNNGAGFTRNFTLTAGTNQLDTLQIGGTTYQYQYDSNGNLIQENASRFFEWDHSDRLRSFRTQAGISEPSVYTHYLYDATGQRVKKVTRKSGASMNRTVYIDDLFEYHRERSGVTTRNNNHLHIMDNVKRIAMRRIGDPFPGDTGLAVQYHLGDHLGSNHLVVNEAGVWTNREEFTPFGETSYGGFAKKRYRFTGKERDEYSGLYYHGARYYAPWLGRWTSCDPKWLADGVNIYAYVRGNPTRLIDEYGTNGMSPELRAAWEAAERAGYDDLSVERLITQYEAERSRTGQQLVTSPSALEYATVRASAAASHWRQGNYAQAVGHGSLAVIESFGYAIFGKTHGGTARNVAIMAATSTAIGAGFGYASGGSSSSVSVAFKPGPARPGHNMVGVNTGSRTQWSHLVVGEAQTTSGVVTGGRAVVVSAPRGPGPGYRVTKVPVSSGQAARAASRAESQIARGDVGPYRLACTDCSSYASSVLNAAGVATPPVTTPAVNYLSVAAQSPSVTATLTSVAAGVTVTNTISEHQLQTSGVETTWLEETLQMSIPEEH